MTVDDLKAHYGVKSDSELASKLGRTRGAISKWRSKGIPIATQAMLQLQSEGGVKANLSQLTT